MNRFRPDWTAALLIVAMLTASPLFSPAVLCVGDDGHVALESTAGGLLSDCHNCHSEALETVMLEREKQLSGVDSCGSCSDSAVYFESCLSSLSDLFGRLIFVPKTVTTALGNTRVDNGARSALLFNRAFVGVAKTSILSAHETVVIRC